MFESEDGHDFIIFFYENGFTAIGEFEIEIFDIFKTKFYICGIFIIV